MPRTRKREKWADPALLDKVRKYGKFDINACLNCGGCTIVCSLTSNGTNFSPRRNIQYVRAGLRDKLRGSLDPWLCYYCGDCTTSCPRETETGESMMTLRRYLFGQYDWVGVASLIFKSKAWEIALLAILGVAMLASILLFFYPQHLLEFGHLFTLATVAAVIFLIFLPNVLRMCWFALSESNPKPPLLLYLTELKSLVIPPITHLEHRKCKGKGLFWLKHWFVAAGYILTLSSVIAGWVSKTYIYPLNHPINLWGIISSIILLASLAMLIVDRIKGTYAQQKFSELSDWLFMTWLFTFVFFLFLSYIFLSLGMEGVGYITYAIFLVSLCPWAIILVPFSKTPHLLYRPVAGYLYAVKEKAIQMELGKESK